MSFGPFSLLVLALPCYVTGGLTEHRRYTMIPVFPILYFGWKIVHKTRILKPHEVDLLKDKAEIDEYERNYIPAPPK